MKILVADDEFFIRKRIIKILNELEVGAVSEAENGKEVIYLLENNDYELKIEESYYLQSYKGLSGAPILINNFIVGIIVAEETEENPLNKLLINERDNVLYKALNKLEGKKKEVLLLQYFSGLSGKDIAKLLGITTENVRILAFRGKKELKLYLKEAGYEI